MSTLLSQKRAVCARKPYRCSLCGERIEAATLHDTRTGVSDGDVWTMRMHPECHDHEGTPGIVDPDWYEDVSNPAFSRADAIAAASKSNGTP